MHKRLKPSSIGVAALLAGMGLVHQFGFVPASWRGANERASTGMPVDVFRAAQQRTSIQDCWEAARLVFDVHWAVACMAHEGQASADQPDGFAECELPDAKAAVVNRWLDEAESQCVADVRAGLGP